MRWLIGLALAIGTSAAAWAQSFQPYNYTALAYCQITVLSAAVGISPTNCSTFKSYVAQPNPINMAKAAEICVSTQAIRYTSNAGETPTSSIGIPVPAATCFQFSSQALANLQFIQQSSGAVLDIELFQ